MEIFFFLDHGRVGAFFSASSTGYHKQGKSKYFVLHLTSATHEIFPLQQTGESRGFAFVDFPSVEAATQVVQYFGIFNQCISCITFINPRVIMQEFRIPLLYLIESLRLGIRKASEKIENLDLYGAIGFANK